MTATQTVTPQSWAAALLTRIGAPVTRNNMVSMLAWEEAEGGQFHNGAHWNPLNTTLDSAKYGSLPGNSAGVAVYPNYQTGLNETAATLREPAYASVLSNLRASAAPTSTTAAVASSPWGTWHDTSPTPNVDTAAAQVQQNPGWVTGTHHPTSGTGTTTIGGKQHPTSGTGTTAIGSATKGASAPDPGARGSGHDQIVLDLPELARLDTTFHDASIDVNGVRSQLRTLQADLGPAIAALKNKALGEWIDGVLGDITASYTYFDSSARQLDDLSQYCGQIHRLAQQADADDRGRFGPGAAERFAKSHPRPPRADEGWEAVIAALSGGKIYRTSPPKDTEPTTTTTRTGKGTGTTTIFGSSTRTQRADKVIDLAASQHGIHETGTNDTKYGAWYGENGEPWCAMYVSWVFAHSGTPLPAINNANGYCYVPSAIDYATAHHELSATPQVGDIFLYKDGEHTGIVTKVLPNGSFETSEGNWGNEVAQQTRVNDGTYDFWNPYPAGAPS